MKCTNCGREIAPGALFCTGCGAKVSDMMAVVEETQPVQAQPEPVQQVQQAQHNQNTGFSGNSYGYNPNPNTSMNMGYNPNIGMGAPVNVNPIPTYNTFVDKNGNRVPLEYKPIRAWGYFGYNILFSIPLVGFIFLLVYALGGTSNVNLKNYARSFFCAFILALILVLVFLVLALILGVSGGSY